eukprot:GHRR01003189.1.p1 GENE.GHRR01003189.1~~GHRR01003189.1.p1  ORF type:complete len:324 (+),score=99.22 GHRR01003189.1:567-1538(+)
MWLLGIAGEQIGDGSPPRVDIAVDPLDGTTLTAQGRSGAIAVIALAERGCMYNPGPCYYMEKLAVGPDVDPRRISLDFTVAHNLEAIANCLGKPVGDVTVLVLDRPRHAKLISEIRAAGARIRMISDGDVGGAIETAKPEAPVDVMMGIGGTPEGVIAAAALKCMGGHIQGRLWARDEEEAAAIKASGRDLERILYTDDLVKGTDCFFAATGVSDGDLLRGVRFFSGGAASNSVVMRGKSQTVRYIETFHKWAGPSSNPSSPWHHSNGGANQHQVGPSLHGGQHKGMFMSGHLNPTMASAYHAPSGLHMSSATPMHAMLLMDD